jgi:phosphate transport system substrate-binding protein
MGRARSSRSDYLATEDDNVVVQGVQGERGALGYFGFSYYEENKDKLKVLAIDQGKGLGCVTPSIRTVQANSYRPLSRPLFVYAKRSAFERPVVAGYFGYIFNNERAIARRSGFIALTDRQLRKARYTYLQALRANGQ